jgi:geranylgeranyl diphosphate synthase type II
MHDREYQDTALELHAMRRLVEKGLASAVEDATALRGGVLRDAVEYAVLPGGKRIRPLLCLAVCHIFRPDFEAALEAACAVEFAHCASLILDDLPCMDDAATRRFQPAHHRRFGESVTILTAMTLLSGAYGLLAKYGRAVDQAPVGLRLIEAFETAVGEHGLIGGQLNDLCQQDGGGDAWKFIESVHELKTVPLFSFAAEAGALVAGADQDEIRAVRAYARHIGMALQVNDDVIDQICSVDNAGKDTQRDGKKQTFATAARLDASARAVNTLIEFAVGKLARFESRAELLVQLPRLIVA